MEETLPQALSERQQPPATEQMNTEQRLTRPKFAAFDVRKTPTTDPKLAALMERAKPLPLGEGAQQWVYSVLPTRTAEAPLTEEKKAPEVVVKVDKVAMVKMMAWNAEHGLPLDQLSPGIEAYGTEVMAQDKQRFQQLRAVMGTDHVLVEKRGMVKVPITPEMKQKLIEEVAPDYNTSLRKVTQGAEGRAETAITAQDVPNEVYAVVAVQRKTDVLDAYTPEEKYHPTPGRRAWEDIQASQEELDRVKFIPVHGAQVEAPGIGFLRLSADPNAQALYRKVTDALMSGEAASQAEILPEEYEEVVHHKAMSTLVEKARQDPGLMKAVREFAERAAKFSNTTGEILDFQGADNIVFNKEKIAPKAGETSTDKEQWTYHLIDPLPAGMPKILEEFRTSGIRLGIPGLVTPEEKLQIHRQAFLVVNYVRIVNGLLKMAGVTEKEKYISVLPPGSKVDVLSLLIPSAPSTDAEIRAQNYRKVVGGLETMVAPSRELDTTMQAIPGFDTIPQQAKPVAEAEKTKRKPTAEEEEQTRPGFLA
ncbi:MAG: hypothetical protein WCV84_03640 [Patescibacteria group bacterium]